MPDFLIELGRWYNLLFILPVFMVWVYQLLHTLTALDISGLDASFGDLDIIVADHLSQPQSRSPLNRFFTFLNAGQIPPQMVFVTFLLCWGFIGFVCNHWFIPLFSWVFPVVLISAFIAFVLSSMITRLISQGIAFLFPTSQADELRRADLVGTVAKVTSGEVNTVFGVARSEAVPFRLTLFCQVDKGEERIKQGEKVLLWDYNPQTHFYKVQRLDGEEWRDK
ncbi:DUF1449 family protein [Candidatus Poribacteria bacterium]|nr:DUF1449 family protein [Candidatus Poribacteria bacterium]